jgi:hypothetical protein
LKKFARNQLYAGFFVPVDLKQKIALNSARGLFFIHQVPTATNMQ